MHFDWDEAKAQSNLRKHRFSFQDAMAVFLDPNRVIVTTARIEDGEDRQKAIGKIGDRFFSVVFVMRGGICRLISARRSNISEERSYDTRDTRSE